MGDEHAVGDAVVNAEVSSRKTLARALAGVRAVPEVGAVAGGEGTTQAGAQPLSLSEARRVVVRRIRWLSEDQRRPWVSARVEVDGRVVEDVAFSRDDTGRPRLAEPRPLAGEAAVRFEGEVRAVLLRIADLVLPRLRPVAGAGRVGRPLRDPAPRCSWEALMAARRASNRAVYSWSAQGQPGEAARA